MERLIEKGSIEGEAVRIACLPNQTLEEAKTKADLICRLVGRAQAACVFAAMNEVASWSGLIPNATARGEFVAKLKEAIEKQCDLEAPA